MNPELVGRFIADMTPAFEAGDPLVAAKNAERENVTRVRGVYETLLSQDPAALAGLFADDLELTISGPSGFPMVGSWKGRDQALQAVAQNFALLEDQKPELLSITAQGEQVAVVARERGRVRATQRDYHIHWLQLFTLKDGRIVRVLQFCDNPTAFAA
jgi:uncharacterized protein